MFNRKKRTVFTLRVVYKSGYTHEFDVYTFSIKAGGSYTWESVDQQNKPLLIGVDEIAAVWQIGVREVAA